MFDVWSVDAEAELFAEASPVSVTTNSRLLQIPIEQVPLGARVQSKHPRPWERDELLPEPEQATWVCLSITMVRDDGGVVDAEILRPRSGVKSNGIEAGQLLPIRLEELQGAGNAFVNSIIACPLIARGEGSVVTARFVTQQVDVIARIEVLGADGQVETIEGTTVHPIWSKDRQDWVPLVEIEEGEQLFGASGIATVLNVAILQRSTAVYNIEVHGEHVYQAGELGVLVHNACEGVYQFAPRAWGSNVPYGGKYLKYFDDVDHPNIHRAFSDFLKDNTGHYFNAKSGAKWRSMLDYRARRKLLIEFHKTHEDGDYWDDFVLEIVTARKNGFNPWGH